VVAATAAVAVGCALSGCVRLPGGLMAAGFVTARGPSFEGRGRPFRFVGFNLYDAAATDRYSCRPSTALTDTKLAGAMREARTQAGATVVRFWAYQSYTAGGTDWSGVDRVIQAAKGAGLRVIPVLEDGPGDCTTGGNGQPKSAFEETPGSSDGYRKPYGRRRCPTATTSHASSGISGTSRRSSAGALINEADTKRPRLPSGRSALVSFGSDIGQVIHSIDHHHLVTVGTQSNGAPGSQRPGLRRCLRPPEVDFAEVHDWGRWGADEVAMPGGRLGRTPRTAVAAVPGQERPIGCSFGGHASWPSLSWWESPGSPATDAAQRARPGRADDPQDGRRVPGPGRRATWSGSFNSAMTDGYDVVIGSHDPLLARMAREAAGLTPP